jgi:hypothetical protein
MKIRALPMKSKRGDRKETGKNRRETGKLENRKTGEKPGTDGTYFHPISRFRGKMGKRGQPESLSE